jgi:hypothetical protein
MWLRVGQPVCLTFSVCKGRMTSQRYTIATFTEKKNQATVEKEERVGRVEAKSSRRGCDAPLPRPPARPPTPREYLYAMSMEWTVWED